ncbi:MAG: bifunctional glutamate N-acetyltransferase/amino-acid acetyltransferase ArgJ [Bacillota bacterium]|nr:bifunctional glutamate N-acetyltransferase/amino-acid acetyltransferase ArgJ [Bacillota bacterium]
MDILSKGTITDVPGILAAGISGGIKKDGKKDLCVIYSAYKANSAAVFTGNNVKAAPLTVDMEHIRNENTQAIVVNSGNANACTGLEGIRNARKMTEVAAACLNLSPQEVLAASTGALSIQLPMEIIVPGIEKACSALSEDGGHDAADAILSTDTCNKTIAVQFELRGRKVTIAGMTKGSTMVHPNMGTTLTFMATDASISKPLLHRALVKGIDDSYNMISVDGDTSTNDMAVIIANGASDNTMINTEDKDYEEFCRALDFVCTELAKMVAKDGEGSTKFIEVKVRNAASRLDARTAARAVVSSSLVKCEVFGSALKSSTVACALGYCGAAINPEEFDIFVGNDEAELQIVKSASETDYNKDELDSVLSGDFIRISADLKAGDHCAVAWGCDLSYQYVKANAYLM